MIVVLRCTLQAAAAAEAVRELENLVATERPSSPEEARALLRTMAGIVRQQGRSHAAMHDLLVLFSETQVWPAPQCQMCVNRSTQTVLIQRLLL